MKYQTFGKITLSLAVLAALAACGDKPAEQAAAPADSAPASAPAASEPAAAQASQAAYDNSGASQEDKDLLQRAQGIFKPLQLLKKCKSCVLSHLSKWSLANHCGMSHVCRKAIP